MEDGWTRDNWWEILQVANNVQGVFGCKGDADRLYFPWKTRAEGLVSVGDCVNIEITNIWKYSEEGEKGQEKGEIKSERLRKYEGKAVTMGNSLPTWNQFKMRRVGSGYQRDFWEKKRGELLC